MNVWHTLGIVLFPQHLRAVALTQVTLFAEAGLGMCGSIRQGRTRHY
jgi:hypothetical protein